MAASDTAWKIANTYCDKSAGVYRLRNEIKRAILDERERCAHIALAIDSKRGNEKEIAKAIRAQDAELENTRSDEEGPGGAVGENADKPDG